MKYDHDEMIEGMELPRVEHLITLERVNAYAEAAGDFNPIHLNAGFAKESHFGRRIAHGMMIAATVSECMSIAFGMDWVLSGSMKIRFRAPVFPGDRIETRGTVKKVEFLDGDKHRVTCAINTVRCIMPDEETVITAEVKVDISAGDAPG